MLQAFRLPDNAKKRRVLGYGEEGNKKAYQKPPFAYNVTWAKGDVHVALSRPFVDYLLHNEVKCYELS